MGCFEHLSHLKRRFSRLRLGRTQPRSGTRGMTIGAPYDFRKVTPDSHRSLLEEVEEEDDGKEKHPNKEINVSRQHLTAKPPPSHDDSSVPTPCLSTADLRLPGSVWADDEASALIPNPGKEGQEDLFTQEEVVVDGNLPRNV